MEAHSLDKQNPFAASEAKFQALIGELRSDEMLGAEHGDVEEMLRDSGREVMRTLLEEHFALRAPATAVEGEVTGSDAVVRGRARRGMQRQLTTLFGTVAVERVGYRARDGGALVPLDAALNLPRDKYSHGVRARVARDVAKTSFEDTSEMLRMETGAPVPKRQVEVMAQSVAVDFDAYYAQRAATPVREEATLLVLGFDGTGVHMRAEALREATRKAREAMPDQDQWPSPMSTGPKRTNGTRSATVSVCYELQPCPRTFKDILRDLRPLESAETDKPRARPKPEAKRVSASLKKPVRQVVREGFEEALRRDPDKKKRWVVLLDGNEHQLDVVQAQAQTTGVKITIIIDFIHVAGYVWGAAKVLRPNDFAQRRTWVMEKLTDILWGRVSTVAAGIRRAATMKNLSAPERKAADSCADYLSKYRSFLAYDEALRDGLPITTSVIEGTCRQGSRTAWRSLVPAGV